MRRIISVFALLVTSALHAQSFSFGPRVSNFSTNMDGGLGTLRTGRETSFGLVGDYRNGQFVLDYQWDRDSSNGVGITNVLVDTGDYTRNRGEVTVGFAIADVADLQGGVRLDTIRIGGFSFFGNAFGSTDIDHQALTAGIRLHSPESQPVGFYVLARGYVGSAKFDDVTGARVNDDTTGYRGEFGIPIRLGESNWRVIPGIEYEHLQTKTYDLRMNTNRAFLSFVYRGGSTRR
jgi:hypothetical protein